ncbi:hypothetical protein FACS1894216_04690 [Synergistales bacterium]|nr:hypothetical protein FACS1894216_04690 [Synergistales bacterium]
MKGRKIKFFLVSLVIGTLYCADVRYDFFRLREISLSPIGVFSDVTAWKAVPKGAQVFWPLLLFDGRDFVRSIERYYPVSVKLSVSGWGKYKLDISPLEPLLYVSWNSKIWLLSRNGRMWPADLPSNAGVKGMTLPKRPILAWDKGLATPIDQHAQSGVIYNSSLPMAKIEKWYDAIDKMGWGEQVYCVMAKKIDGRPVVQLLMGSQEGIASEVILKQDTSDWPRVAAALGEIYGDRLSALPKGLFVNATFTDSKFIVNSRDVK